ncbi:TetR/AcrR family transcriptional regulator [Micromonospora sp. NPDC005979]|uniref:TetR/AcrR family transcriptional regulator n=1 Tax=Micromonospora sp. NPDC005979 TaxID=3156726 RepID=UPI0033A6C6B3
MAGDVFTEQGTNASMNEIAKRAGVGPGTLYRHFRDRDHLLDVLLADWIGRIQSAADEVIRTDLTPRALLITWFEALIAHISVHRGGAARFTTALGNPESTMASKWQGLVTANTTVLHHLERLEAIQPGVRSLQVCRLVGGVGTVADNGDLSSDDTKDLLNIIADALLIERSQPPVDAG